MNKKEKLSVSGSAEKHVPSQELQDLAPRNHVAVGRRSFLRGLGMPQYISDNTDDELSHAAFLNAYLSAHGAEPVNLDQFRHLPSSTATGVDKRKIGKRLTNLLNLNVDLSWYTRYRSEENPDLGVLFKGPLNILNEPGIPLNDADTSPTITVPPPPIPAGAQRIQAIANTAGFHFAFIDQGGASLYPTLALKATSDEVLRILLSFGGVEIDHFSLWHDKAGNAVSQPLAGVIDPSFTADGLFNGQPESFFDFAMQLATAADNAQRQL